MPGIWNINSAYNVGSKKLSSKLTFEVGERFSGRVVKASLNKGEFTIKLLDGWQFIAQLDESVTPEQLEQLLKFQVLGFEDGKLKLKLVRQDGERENKENDPLQALIKSQGLPKEEMETLRQLVKFNIPLTKENVSKYSSIFNFNQKIKIDENEADNFINNYIASKNISQDSKEGKGIKEKLQNFFKEFKTMTPEDILTFIENDIDLTEDNIKAFNRVFKGSESIEKILLKAPTDGTVINEENNNKFIVNNNIKDNNYIDTKELRNILPKEAYINSNSEKKISILDMLKKISGDLSSDFDNEAEVLNTQINNLNNNESVDKNTIINYLKANNIDVDALTDKEIEKFIDILNKESNTISRDNDVPSLKNISSTEIKKLQEFINAFEKQGYTIGEESPLDSKIDEFVNVKETVKDTYRPTTEVIKETLKEKSIEIKDIIKEILVASKDSKDDREVFSKILEFIKGNANEVKVFNSLSNNYYYMHIPLKVKQDEYECKLIVKDERGKGKKIDSSNLKMIVSVKTINLGNVDAYLNLQNKNLYIDLKCAKNFVNILEKEKNKLIESLSSLGYNSKVIVSRAIEEVNISTSRDFFNSTNLVILDRKV